MMNAIQFRSSSKPNAPAANQVSGLDVDAVVTIGAAYRMQHRRVLTYLWMARLLPS